MDTISIAINLPVNRGYDPQAYVDALVQAQTAQAAAGNAIAAMSLSNLIAMVSNSQAHGVPVWTCGPTLPQS